MRVVFLHPDLGIGGAERLIVDAALALKSKGHSITIITNHRDQCHCFPETKDGTLDVLVRGNWFPRSFGGGCVALLAYLRMICAAVWLIRAKDLPQADVVICDQVSACIPVLRLFYRKAKVVFYCHFPDQLLTQRDSWLKWLYRCVVDWVEEKTTGMAHCILVNSNFTAGKFRQTFWSLRDSPLQVLYPSLHTSAFDKAAAAIPGDMLPASASHVFLSVNRYERKKNISLAVSALGILETRVTPETFARIHLVIAGGFDDRVTENREYHQELQALVNNLELSDHITFLKSPSEESKRALLEACLAVVYTPTDEHFGIVPIEAMYCGRPVIAVASGGPLESVLHNETGLLMPPKAEDFAAAMLRFIDDPQLAARFGMNGRRHVEAKFGFDTFTANLNDVLTKLCTQRRKDE